MINTLTSKMTTITQRTSISTSATRLDPIISRPTQLSLPITALHPPDQQTGNRSGQPTQTGNRSDPRTQLRADSNPHPTSADHGSLITLHDPPRRQLTAQPVTLQRLIDALTRTPDLV